jgi:hypothetical protein
MSWLLSSSSSIQVIGLLSITLSGTGICRQLQRSRFLRVIQSRTHTPRIVLQPRRRSRSSHRLTASLKPKQARRLRFRMLRRLQQPQEVCRPLSLRLASLSLSNQRQLLMGAFCPTTDGVELTGYNQESIQVSRNLSLKLNSYLSWRLGCEYPVNVHAHRPCQPSYLVVEGCFSLQDQHDTQNSS